MIYQLLQQFVSETTANTRQCWLTCDGALEFNKMEVLMELLGGDTSMSLNNGSKLIPTGIWHCHSYILLDNHIGIV